MLAHSLAFYAIIADLERLYRAATLKYLSADVQAELQWLNAISLKHLKNYQIWHHRQVIMSQLSSLPTAELPFLARMLAKDAKNYHVWSYRQWLVRHFSLWPTIEQPGPELEFTESLIENDVRNNSAWNHRFFVLFGRDHVDEPYRFEAKDISDEIWDREVVFAKARIAKAPQNASAWNYLGGVLRKRKVGLSSLKDFALTFADIEKADEVRSSFALDILADIWSDEREVEKAKKALDLLAERFDPIRKNYWNWKAQSLEAATA